MTSDVDRRWRSSIWTARRRRSAEERRSDTARAVRHAWHAVVIVVGWILFVGFWVRAVDITDTGMVVTIGWLIGGGLVVVTTMTLLWIAHNVSIARRKGPRRAVPVVQEHFVQDATGRPLLVDWERVRGADVVLVGLGSEGEKRYEAEPVPVDAADPTGMVRA